MEVSVLMEWLLSDEYTKKYRPSFHFVDDVPTNLDKNKIYLIHSAKKKDLFHQNIIFGHFFSLDTLSNGLTSKPGFKVTIFDSYGRKTLPNLRLKPNYLVESNHIRYQVTATEQTCGYYVLYHLSLRARGFSLKEIQEQMFGFCPEIWKDIPVKISALLSSRLWKGNRFPHVFTMNHHETQQLVLDHGKGEEEIIQEADEQSSSGYVAKKLKKSQTGPKDEKKQANARPSGSNPGAQKKRSAENKSKVKKPRKRETNRKARPSSKLPAKKLAERICSCISPYVAPTQRFWEKSAAANRRNHTLCKKHYQRSANVQKGFDAIQSLIEAFNSI